MMTNAVVIKVNIRKYNADFRERVHQASKEDQDWQERKTGLNEGKQHGLKMPKHGDTIEG